MGRLIVGLALGLSALFIATTVIVSMRGQRYDEERKRLHALMSEDDRALQAKVLEARADSSDLVLALGTLQVERQALNEANTHLRVDLTEGKLTLVQDSRVLREAKITVGEEAEVQSTDGRRWFFPLPMGELEVTRVALGESFETPAWWYVETNSPDPGDGARTNAQIYGEVAIILSDGTLIYSHPIEGPWVGEATRHGSMEASAEDLKAIIDTLSSGMAVYAY